MLKSVDRREAKQPELRAEVMTEQKPKRRVRVITSSGIPLINL